MDRRIEKTRKSLRIALGELMGEITFDKITVRQICERADTGRVTFYKHYKDKYDLLADCFHAISVKKFRRYNELQEKNNPDGDPVQTYQNFADAFIDEQEENILTYLLDIPDLLIMYYRESLKDIEEFEDSHPEIQLNSKYNRRQLNAFLVLGLWGFIHGDGHLTEEEVRKNTMQLISDLMNSPYLIYVH